MQIEVPLIPLGRRATDPLAVELLAAGGVELGELQRQIWPTVNTHA